MKQKVHTKDEMGILNPEHKPIPYLCVTISKEEFEALELHKNRRLHLYQTDGRKVFEVRDENGHTGQYVIYLVASESHRGE